MAESVEWTDKWRALPDDLREKCRRLLKVLVEPSYTPTTGSDLAANIMGWAGPAYTTYFIPARDALARLGFITYAWGIPVTVSRDFQGFLAAAGPAWEAVLDGHRVPVAPTPPAQAQAGPAFPSLVEDEAFWNRIHTQVGPSSLTR